MNQIKITIFHVIGWIILLVPGLLVMDLTLRVLNNL